MVGFIVILKEVFCLVNICIELYRMRNIENEASCVEVLGIGEVEEAGERWRYLSVKGQWSSFVHERQSPPKMLIESQSSSLSMKSTNLEPAISYCYAMYAQLYTFQRSTPITDPIR